MFTLELEQDPRKAMLKLLRGPILFFIGMGGLMIFVEGTSPWEWVSNSSEYMQRFSFPQFEAGKFFSGITLGGLTSTILDVLRVLYEMFWFRGGKENDKEEQKES